MATGILLGGESREREAPVANQDQVLGGAPTQGTLPAAGSSITPKSNGRGERLVVQSLPERAEIVRLGRSWHYSIPTGSAFTTVAGNPTTRAELLLSNIAAAGGMSLVIDEIWAETIVTETAASSLSICCQMSPAGLVAVAADNTAVLARCLNGKSGATGRAPSAAAAIANTAFGVASQWHFPHQTGALGGGAVSIGQLSVAKLNGLYVVQPGATFLMNLVVGTAVASAGIMGVVFHEAQVDLGS